MIETVKAEDISDTLADPPPPPQPSPFFFFFFLIGRVGVGGWDRGKWGRKRLLSIVTSVKSLSLLMVIEAVTAEDSHIRLARGPSPLSLPPTFPWVGLGLGLGMGGGVGGRGRKRILRIVTSVRV